MPTAEHRRGVAAILLLVGCGRYGFTPIVGDAQDDAPGDGDMVAPCTTWQLRVTNDPAMSAAPAIAATADDIGIAWEDARDGNREIYFARVGHDGQKVSTDVRITFDAAVSATSSIAAAGSQYALAWVTPTSAETVLITDTNAQMFNVIFPSASGVSIGWTGSQLVVALVVNGDIHYARWTPGDIISRMLKVSSGLAFSPALVWTGSESGIAYVDPSVDADNIWFVRIAADDSVIGAESRLSTADFGATSPALAWSGSEYAVTWSDYRTDALARLRLSRFAPGGTPIDNERELTDDLYSVGTSAIAWTGAGYSIVWDETSLFETRLDAQGIATPHVPLPAGTAPAITRFGDSVVVAWESGGEIHAARLCR